LLQCGIAGISPILILEITLFMLTLFQMKKGIMKSKGPNAEADGLEGTFHLMSMLKDTFLQDII